jgi:hypothetical protein
MTEKDYESVGMTHFSKSEPRNDFFEFLLVTLLIENQSDVIFSLIRVCVWLHENDILITIGSAIESSSPSTLGKVLPNRTCPDRRRPHKLLQFSIAVTNDRQ